MDAIRALMKGVAGAISPHETTEKVAYEGNTFTRHQSCWCLDIDFLLFRIWRSKYRVFTDD